MAEKRVSVRFGSEGGNRLKAEFRGIGEAGAKGMARIRKEMALVNARLAALGRRLGRVFRVAGLAIAGAVGLAVRSSLALIDSQAKLAQSLGSTTASIQVLQRAGDLAGVSLGQIEQGTIQLTRRLSQAAAGTGPAVDALDRLGLSADDLAQLPLDERIATIQDAIERLIPPTQRAAVASQLFGDRAGVVFSRIDSATLRQATEDVRDFGVAVSEQDADRIEQTNDALSRLALIGRGVANRLTVALAPALKAAADGIAAISRTGGPVARALEGLGRAAKFAVDNFRLLASIAGSFVAFLIGRFVGGLAAAALGVRGLATMLVVLRGALIRTGIGALIVGAGFLVDFLIRLREATGSWGEALGLLGDVAEGVWDKIKRQGKAMGLGLKAVFADMKSDFLGALADMVKGVANFAGRFSALAALPDVGPLAPFAAFGRLASGVESASADLRDSSIEAQGDAIAAQAEADALRQGSNRSIDVALTRLRETMGGVADGTTDASDEARKLAEDLEDLGVPPEVIPGVEEVGTAAAKAGAAGAKAGEDIEAGADRATAGWARTVETLRDFASRAGDFAGQIGEVLTGAFQSAENAFRSFAEGGKVSFKGLIGSILADLATLSFRANVLGPLADALAGAFGGLVPSARGNVVAGGRVVPFASGGIVDRPTLFPLRAGTGLAGEAGPEAILPLKRIGGRLGVEATGGGRPVTVDLRLFVDRDGNWRAEVERISDRVSKRNAAAAVVGERRAFGDRAREFDARGTT